MSLRTAVLAFTALLVPATALATPATNGKAVNTNALNGKAVNGKAVNNASFEAVRTEGAWKDGFSLGGTGVQGSGLAGWGIDWSADAPAWEWRTGTWYEGTDMIARFINGTDGEAETVRLHIDHIVPAEQGSDVLLHWVSVHSTVVNQWQNIPAVSEAHPLCMDADGKEIPAIVLQGEWSLAEGVPWGGDQISDDPFQVTFACADGALGKCAADCVNDGTCAAKGVPVALGYRRWAEPRWWAVEEDGGMVYRWRDYEMEHQACTRMIRADYCGDGVSHTENGTQIDVYDQMRDNRRDPAHPNASWFYEATWNEDGAVQVTCGRVDEEPITCGPTGVGAPAIDALDLDYDASPMRFLGETLGETTSVAHPLACMVSDGMDDPAARLGNLRRDKLETPGGGF